jgi:hypothetical protein
MHKKLNDAEAADKRTDDDVIARRRRTRSARDGDAAPPMAVRTPGLGRILNISTRAAQRLISTGAIPSLRIGGIRLIRIGAVEKFLASRESSSEEA